VDITGYAVGHLTAMEVGIGFGIAYRAPTAFEELRFALTDFGDPTSLMDWSLFTVEENVGIGGSVEVALLSNGLPAVAYMDALDGELRLAQLEL
jgi:hypothetical protein